MPRIISVGTAVPKYIITQQEAKDFSENLFRNKFRDIERLLKIFDNTQISKRHFCVPLEWFSENHSFEEKNTIYVKNAIELAKKAIKNALINTNIKLNEINHIIFVSSTGISAPSIDAFLFNDPELEFNQHIKRTPIWGLGCAGGAAGLSRAYEYTKAFPAEIVLVIALEIGELAFLREDISKSNLVATSLFADGAAAVIITGDNTPNQLEKQLNIKDSLSTIWKNTLDVMGWDVKNEGLKVIFSKDIPTIIKKDLKPNIDYFLAKNKINYHDLEFYVFHPGGTKVLEAYLDVFNIPEEKLSASKGILNDYGNMSSPTVLFVLAEIMQTTKSGVGLLLALGPGFSSETLLLEWR